MRAPSCMVALVLCGLTAPGGCATQQAALSPEPPAALWADQSNEQLGATLTREFPLGSTREEVLQRAAALGLEPVRQARVVDERGQEVALNDVPSGQSEFERRGWRVEDTSRSDPQFAAFQLAASAPESEADSRALLFVFGPDRRLRGISVSPAMGSRPTHVVSEAFTLGNPAQEERP